MRQGDGSDMGGGRVEFAKGALRHVAVEVLAVDRYVPSWVRLEYPAVEESPAVEEVAR